MLARVRVLLCFLQWKILPSLWRTALYGTFLFQPMRTWSFGCYVELKAHKTTADVRPINEA